jgi:hypothetical protein
LPFPTAGETQQSGHRPVLSAICNSLKYVRDESTKVNAGGRACSLLGAPVPVHVQPPTCDLMVTKMGGSCGKRTSVAVPEPSRRGGKGGRLRAHLGSFSSTRHMAGHLSGSPPMDNEAYTAVPGSCSPNSSPQPPSFSAMFCGPRAENSNRQEQGGAAHPVPVVCLTNYATHRKT